MKGKLLVRFLREMALVRLYCDKLVWDDLSWKALLFDCKDMSKNHEYVDLK